MDSLDLSVPNINHHPRRNLNRSARRTASISYYADNFGAHDVFSDEVEAESNSTISDYGKRRAKEQEQCENTPESLHAGQRDKVKYTRKKQNSERHTNSKPRWWNQTYLVFLTLREAARPLTRSELIPAVLKLDKVISKQRKLPTLFGGKTPKNTCSAILTENRDRLFIGHKPASKKDKWKFSLAYVPGDFNTARETYSSWMEILIQHDWPIFFRGGCREELHTKIAENSRAPGYVDQPINYVAGYVDSCGVAQITQLTVRPNSSPVADLAEDNIATDNNREGLEGILRYTHASVKGGGGEAHSQLENQDRPIPASLDELVETGPSRIPNAGLGLFAKRYIPARVILGFYFGVPMTEDEFDAIKDGVGLASNYSHRYRNTVLDATDENGQPYTKDHPSGFFCPFHFVNDDLSGCGNLRFLEGSVVNQIICATTRDVHAGEELFANYGTDVEKGQWMTLPVATGENRTKRRRIRGTAKNSKGDAFAE
ncbi:hypothetical protein BJ742DRAFT_765649 [Cladochytrium replicatum]|nr:hypothetical protein BJ742DRAFT_765649 [Cladochytrium replicatum]